MTNSRLLLIGACIAVLAAVLASAVQRLIGSDAGTDGAVAQVMSAKTELPAGHRLTAADLEPKQAAVGSGPKAASTDARALVGRTLTTGLRKGQVVRQEHLAAKGSGQDIAAQLPAGHRAITVVLRDPVAATSLFPGALVDVLVTMDRGGSGSTKEAFTRVAIERARVLALADDVTATRAAAAGEIGSGSARTPQVKKVAVTLDVTAEQAAELELAGSRGIVGLALRPESDTLPAGSTASTPTSASVEAAKTGAAAPSAASGRQGNWEVIVIRGDDRVKHDFPERAGSPKP